MLSLQPRMQRRRVQAGGRGCCRQGLPLPCYPRCFLGAGVLMPWPPPLLTPFSSHRCASAPTWTRMAGWCRVGRQASFGHTAWWDWPLAWATSCCRSVVPASATFMGTSLAAPALPSNPCCRQSSMVDPLCCCQTCSPWAGAWAGGRLCCPAGLCAPSRCFLPSGPLPWGRDGCSWLFTWDRAPGPEGSFCAVWSELVQGWGAVGLVHVPGLSCGSWGLTLGKHP